MVDPEVAGVDGILPHRPPMLLLDRVDEDAGDRTVASWTVSADCAWLRDGVLDDPALLEVAAQTAAAGAGLRRLAMGLPPEAGYLGAVSGFEILRSARPGDRLRCAVEVRFRVGNLVRVDAEIHRLADGGAAEVVARGGMSLATSPTVAP